jgi:hypothetical protein
MEDKNNKKADGQTLGPVFCTRLTKNFCFGVHDATDAGTPPSYRLFQVCNVVIRRIPPPSTPNTNTTEVAAAIDNEDESEFVITTSGRSSQWRRWQ